MRAGIAWIGNGLLATANEGDLEGGSRGWTIFDAATGQVVWDAGNTVERLAIRVGLYPESRSDSKGTEPENIAVGTIDGRSYAFVGAEPRAGRSTAARSGSPCSRHPRT